MIQTNTLFGGKKLKLAGVPDGDNFVSDPSLQAVAASNTLILSAPVPTCLKSGTYFRIVNGGGSNQSNLFKVLSVNNNELIVDDTEPETSSLVDFGPGQATIDARIWQVVNDTTICKASLNNSNTIFNAHALAGSGLDDGSCIAENFAEHFHYTITQPVEEISFIVTETGHGRTVGPAIIPVYLSKTTGLWTDAIANSKSTLALHTIVSVIDANTFKVAMLGKYSVPSHGLTPGYFYFTDPTTAGAITDTEPTDYSNPVVFAIDSNYIHVIHYRPTIALGDTVLRNCTAAALEGELVTQSTTITNGVDVITDNTAVRPVMGIIVKKETPTATECQVLIRGELTMTFLGSTPIVKGSRIWIGTDGYLTSTPPATGYVQNLGSCVETNKIDFNPALIRVKRYEP